MSLGRPLSSSSLQLLDVSFHLEADWPEALGLLNRLFIAPEFHQHSDRPTIRVKFHLDTASEPACTVTVDGSAEKFRLSGEPGSDVSEWVFQRFLLESKGFTLVHAAALARHGRGALFVGGPRAGKTTLAMSLAEQGLEYYSDDVAPVSRVDGALHPFRRAAGVRIAGEARQYMLPNRSAGSTDTPGPPPPCPLGWVFFLQNRSAAASARADASARIEEVPPDQAALSLLEHTMNREPYGRLSDRYGEHPHLKAFADLLTALATARSYRLSAGRPDETTRTLIELMDNGRHQAAPLHEQHSSAG